MSETEPGAGIKIGMRAEIRDNWYVITMPNDVPLAIGTWLPPESHNYKVRRVEPDEARLVIDYLRLASIDHDFWSIRVASNNRLLTVGMFRPPYPVHGIQEDRIMPDQARELLDELRVRSEGDNLVGVIEGQG